MGVDSLMSLSSFSRSVSGVGCIHSFLSSNSYNSSLVLKRCNALPPFTKYPLSASSINTASSQRLHFAIKEVRPKFRTQKWQQSTVCSSAGAGFAGDSPGDEGHVPIVNEALEKSRLQTDPNFARSDEEPRKMMGTIKVVTLAVASGLLLATLGILISGGPTALRNALTQSGFAAAFSLILVSELGDKTFFIAALLAMRQSRTMVLAGATTALAAMTVISVMLGRIFHNVPARLQTSLPIGTYAATALLVYFGLLSIRAAMELPSKVPGGATAEVEDFSELAEAEEFVSKLEMDKINSPLFVFWEACSLVFVAEWGDRSMLATVALGAAQSPVGVASGAILGHFIATLIAVLGGSLLANYVSEKVVGLIGGVLFLVFAGLTLAGVF